MSADHTVKDKKEVEKKIVKLYDGSITVHFSNKARNRYVIQETEHSPVGVTTILQMLGKEGLALWPMTEALEWLKTHKNDFEGAAKAYTIKSDLGKDVGTEVHGLVETYLKNLESGSKTIVGDVTPEAKKAFKAFTEWFIVAEPIVLATEQIIYSKEYDYAGTYDALLEIEDKVVLCDIKTTNSSRYAPMGIYPEMFLQLGGYALAHHEENPLERVDDAMIIRVGKDGTLNTLRASELGLKLAYLEDTFKNVVQTYKMLTPLKKQLAELGKE